jgi:ATP-dependent Clp protease ATP-binding subunit ClpC
MAGDASENGQSLSEAIAETLFDDRDRIVTIDFSRFGQPEDISLLLGAPPGYVGYSDRIPLHQLIQTPWCVLFFDQVDLCHPRIREVVAQALLDGWVLDGRGKKIYLSDAIVIMTSGFSLQSHRGLGFTPEKEKLTYDDIFDAVAVRIGDNLADQVDLYAFGAAHDQGVSIAWLKEQFLVELARRFQKRGVRIIWDASMLDWMEKHQQSNQLNEHEWEHWVDRMLAPAIIPHLPAARQSTARELIVKVDGENLVIQPA